MDYVIRQLTCQDEPILWEMLYYGLVLRRKKRPPSRDVVRRPEISRYVEAGAASAILDLSRTTKKIRLWLGAAWLDGERQI